MFPNIWNNDEAIQFFEENNYPRNYNDGLYAYLRDIYAISNTYSIPSLPDLLKRYLNDYGDTFNMPVVVDKSAVAVSLIEPAATFTATTPTSAAGGADTLLTSAGVHGLTSAVAVGASIYISAGTGWIPGFHRITAIAVDTSGTTIQIDTPFDASMGTPTIALANTIVSLSLITIPALLSDSSLDVDVTFSVNDSTGNPDVRITWGGTHFYSTAFLGTNRIQRWNARISNVESTAIQKSFWKVGDVGSMGTTSSTVTTGVIDTSVPTTLSLGGRTPTANVVVRLEAYHIIVSR